MKLIQVLTEEKVTALPNGELLAKSYARIVGAAVLELEESFRLAMIEHFPTFKYDVKRKQIDAAGIEIEPLSTALSSSGSFTLYGETFNTQFSTSGFSVRLVKGPFTSDSQSVESFAAKVYDGIKNMLTKQVLQLKPESPSFRADYLKLQQDFVDRDLEVEIDHVPDKKTIITVESEDKKLRFKVKVK